MVEIHEPARLAIVVEAPRDRVERVVRNNAAIERLVRNRWLWLACLDPDSGALWEAGNEGFQPQHADQAVTIVTGDSAAWYQGKRGFLPPASIVPAAEPTRAAAS
jgi:hypothetical protein